MAQNIVCGLLDSLRSKCDERLDHRLSLTRAGDSDLEPPRRRCRDVRRRRTRAPRKSRAQRLFDLRPEALCATLQGCDLDFPQSPDQSLLFVDQSFRRVQLQPYVQIANPRGIDTRKTAASQMKYLPALSSRGDVERYAGADRGNFDVGTEYKLWIGDQNLAVEVFPVALEPWIRSGCRRDRRRVVRRFRHRAWSCTDPSRRQRAP